MIYMLGTDRGTRAFADTYLKNEGYETALFETPELLLTDLVKQEPSLCLIDLTGRGDSGFSFITDLRAVSSAPLIVLYGNGSDALWRITALTLGADECLSKEVLPPELSARIKAFFRRIELTQQAPKPIPDEGISQDEEVCRGAAISELLCYGDIVLDLKSRCTLCGEQSLDLTPNEFEFMSYMIRRSSAVKKEELLSLIWGDSCGNLKSRAADDLVKRLRRKLKAADSTVEIISIWAYGYRLSLNRNPMQISGEFHPM